MTRETSADPSRFNGATAMKPWKSTDSVPMRDPRARGFNGATAMRPWKSAPDRRLAPALHGFNGATAMKPWKSTIESRQRLRRDRSFNGATAMKPWKSIATRVIAHVDERRFNGATAMRPWKSAGCRAIAATVTLLQWGHGDEAVEEREHAAADAARAAASMGPRR